MTRPSKTPAIRRPALRRWYASTASEDGLGFRYGDHALVMRGAATTDFLPELLPLLDGTRDVSELEAEVGPDLAPGVPKALELLAQHGLLYEGGRALPGGPDLEATARFFVAADEAAPSPRTVMERLGGHRVALAGGSAAGDAIAELLARGGVSSLERLGLDAPPAALADFSLALTVPEGGELPSLTTFNRSALEAGLAWLPVLPFDGTIGAIGPLFIPGESCCYECFILRREAADGAPPECSGSYAQAIERPEAPALTAVAAGLAATLALRWMATQDPTLPGELYAVEYHPAPSVTRHRVFRVPRCGACSPIAGCSIPDAWAAPRPSGSNGQLED